MTSKSPLLRLPRELRDKIIANVFNDSRPQTTVDFKRYSVADGKEITPPYLSLPALCKTSQQLYYEATPDFLSRITPALYNIETICWFQNWLASFPSNSGFRAIRQLAFRNFHGPEQIKGYELIALCTNLRSLNIKFGDEYASPGTIPSLAITSLSSSVNAYENLDNIIYIHQLYRLLDISRLERLEFGFHDWEQPISVDRAREVMEWLRDKFQAIGRTVYIECKQMMYVEDSDGEFGCSFDPND
ncbi:uncharacterized protein K460DRAFT_417572 [Cucurbitaria berberidis CBS 394.84]|uniref:F-box domain-containing protein n=1 Tax=Cucurbitaria berberidis CBS 394.84 TaxID=1168544 RepID=A0A9P4GHZ2_9PLEO|nr:uncharacterized protein K460DRAFT_417572 [Cucurbitaria berberidis CBS 394.84]KAF1846508.1 hypothetical protein K460DRAFT_417572 [Cucurbitaria berberidis CBS 394.84]